MRTVSNVTVGDLIESQFVNDKTEIRLETEHEIFEGNWFEDFILWNIKRQLVKVEIDMVNNSVIGTLKED